MIWFAALIAIFVWWLSTGLILLAVRRADRNGGHARVVILGLPLLLIGVWAVGWSLTQANVAGVYAGFLGALAIWGWIELGFLAGVITGPLRAGMRPGLTPFERFSRAFQTIAYHELLLGVALLGLVVGSDGAVNRMGVAAFLVLFVARIGAKLNLFFGVPRINTEFVPARLVHLKDYFRKGPITAAFPLAITVLTLMLSVCVERLLSAQGDVALVGFTLLAALTALALLEHWLMVVPLPDAKLWRWMLPAPKTHHEESERHGL